MENVKNEKLVLSKNLKRTLLICLILALIFGGLSIYSLASEQYVKELNARVDAYTMSVAKIKAAELLGQDTTGMVALEPVEVTAFDNLRAKISESFRFFFVIALDMVIISIALVLNELQKQKRKNAATAVSNGLGKKKVGSSSNIVGILIALCVLFFDLSLLTDVFLTTSNLINVTQQVSVNFIAATGMTFVLLTGGIDISIGSNMAVSALFMAMMMNYWNQPVPLTVLSGIVLSTCIGLVNGTIITKLKLPPYIATLGMMYVGRGLAYTITSGRTISDFPEGFKAITARYGGLPIYTYMIMITVFVIAWYILKYTRFGRYTYAIGGNETCTKLSGINVDRYKILVYTVNGFCCGIAAVILGSRLNSATVTNADGYEMDAIAAVVIGGTSMSGGEGSIFGTLIGIFIIGLISNGLNLLGVGQGIQKIVKGVIIVIAVVIDVMRRRSAEKAK